MCDNDSHVLTGSLVRMTGGQAPKFMQIVDGSMLSM